jgi:EAL domain-containing protein (putative c-di-GMP-specific phosphodiesterase class I)
VTPISAPWSKLCRRLSGSRARGLALVSTIINLGQALNLKLVAEGVETEEEARLLRLLRCDETQGYLYGRPVPCDTFEAVFLDPRAAA